MSHGQETAARTGAAGAPVEDRLRSAIEHGDLHLHYQVVVDLPGGRVTGVEALARWDDAELGSVPPDEFIHLAERTGLIVSLGRWVLRTACRQAAAWTTGNDRLPPVMSVNVSPLQLMEASFADDVAEALRGSGLSPGRLCLEITETAVVADLTEAVARLWQVRRLGVRLALDDFGTGHSSLTLLRHLPVHLVKIDRRLVERVATDAGDAVLARLVVDAAHHLGLRVCAEGVNTPEQARQLVAIGCDSAQGWLFGHAATAEALDVDSPATPSFDPDGPPPVALAGSDELVVVTTPDRIVTYVSSSSRSVLGYTPGQIIGRRLRHLVPDDDPEGQTTVHVRHADGTDRWLRGTVQRLLDETGSVREVLGVFHDETEIVVPQRALAASETLFRHAFTDAPIGMALTALDGTILRANTAFSRLVGRGVDELPGLPVSEITHPDDLAKDASNLAALRSGAATSQRVRKRYRHAAGHDVPVEVHAALVAAADGEQDYVVAHVLPI